ncbi:MAG TPA: sensor histidine kinase [Gaiellaceae bacterium]|nr:sensor histidine kinase [Gaiellaceae bacterium]
MLARRPDPVAVDRLLAVVLALDAVLEALLRGDGGGNRVVVALLGATMTLPLAVRRRFPLLVGAGIPVVGAFDHWLWDPQAPAYPIAEFCALYALAAWTPTRRFLLGAGLFVLTAVLTPGRTTRGGTLFVVVVLVVMLLVRRILGDRERRAELAERERDLAAREAVVEERARIARELHDAIAHHVSMMVVQAGAERRILDGGSGSTREVLQTIEQIGRGALTEMRRLVGMLRSADSDPLSPQPSLADLPRLVAQVSDAGLPVEIEIEGERRELPLGVELSAYRIVQEALTNALKHAGEARATVRVRYSPDQLELEVADDGAGAPAAVTGGGHGLAGMRERVALYGGRLDAGRRGDRGFTVRVVLPIR